MERGRRSPRNLVPRPAPLPSSQVTLHKYISRVEFLSRERACCVSPTALLEDQMRTDENGPAGRPQHGRHSQGGALLWPASPADPTGRLLMYKCPFPETL